MKNKHKYILVVDDEQKITEQIEKILVNNLDCSVDVAYNGKEALDKMEDKERYDLLIIAILIPKLNGIEVCGYMMRGEKLKTIPVLLISLLPLNSDAFNKSLKKFYEFRVVKGLLEKPFSNEDLLAKVQTIINK